MSDIVLSEGFEITDPKLKAVAERVFQMFQVATEKAVAHAADPAKFPMPADATAVERIMLARFQALPAPDRKAAITRNRALINATKAARRQRLGDLADVDLRSNDSIRRQIRGMPVPQSAMLSKVDMERINTAVLGGPEAVIAAPAPGAKPPNRLELRLHQVKCIDETNGFLGTEAGEDEIGLGGNSIDETGDVKPIAPFHVGDFDDGDVKNFNPPRRFTFFNINEGSGFPKAYHVIFVLAEKDMGGLPSFVNSLEDKVREEVKDRLVELGVAIGASGGPVNAIIGAAVGWVVGKVFDFLGRLWGDDIFTPQQVKLTLPSANHRFAGGRADSADRKVTFKGHGGTYSLTYDWRLFRT